MRSPSTSRCWRSPPTRSTPRFPPQPPAPDQDPVPEDETVAVGADLAIIGGTAVAEAPAAAPRQHRLLLPPEPARLPSPRRPPPPRGASPAPKLRRPLPLPRLRRRCSRRQRRLLPPRSCCPCSRASALAAETEPSDGEGDSRAGRSGIPSRPCASWPRTTTSTSRSITGPVSMDASANRTSLDAPRPRPASRRYLPHWCACLLRRPACRAERTGGCDHRGGRHHQTRHTREDEPACARSSPSGWWSRC